MEQSLKEKESLYHNLEIDFQENLKLIGTKNEMIK